MTGVIFDFNGTLFDDGEKQQAAWRSLAKTVFGRTISEEEFAAFFYGRNTEFSLQYLAGHPMDRQEIQLYTEQLVARYRELCDADKAYTRFTGDTIRLLDELKQRGIPVAIATASPKSNVDWYHKTFGLSRWFGEETIVYDDGTLRGKPEPDFYLKAAERIGVQPADCVVFEDAVSGLESARRAGIGTIIAKAPEEQAEQFAKLPGVCAVIRDFDAFDRQLLGDG